MENRKEVKKDNIVVGFLELPGVVIRVIGLFIVAGILIGIISIIDPRQTF